MQRLLVLLVLIPMAAVCLGQAPSPKKHLLVIGEEKGYRHESVSHAMAVIEWMGRESGEWDTTLRTDTEPLTKKKLEYNAKNLNDFDAIVFYTGGTRAMDDERNASLLQFVKDDGKGIVAVHSAAITWTKWPEWVDMVGGTFDQHPWGTFQAPIVVEDSTFPGMNSWPKEFALTDEIYQQKLWDRSKVHVLMRLDAGKLDLTNKNVHRSDKDFAVTWVKQVGRGRVFYSTLGHPVENWDDPRMQAMYKGAIEWALGLVRYEVPVAASQGSR